jgi:threonine dehydrogenase-like Zn-dependent dehydrogenase
VVDRVSEGAKPRQVEALGASYHTEVSSLSGQFDAVLECSGALVGEAIDLTASAGVCCLIGGGENMGSEEVRLGALARDLMTLNKAVVGVMSSNRHHFEVAVRALNNAPVGWLRGLIGPCVPLDDWRSAFEIGPQNIKAVVSLQPGANEAY